MKHELTLAEVKQSPKLGEQVVRASDFLSEQQIEELHEANRRGKTIVRPYDEIDAFAAEILARFGWETYRAWQRGEFSHEKALRFIAAERARTVAEGLPMQITLVSAVAGSNNPTKSGNAPQSLKNATRLLKEQQKQAKGMK